MKKKIPFAYFLLFLGIAFFWFSYSSNPPNGRTGAPGDSGTCASCHTGNNQNNFDGNVTLQGIPATITPNTNYPVTVTVTNPNGQAQRGGFQWVPLFEGSNSLAGSISNSDGSSTITNSGGRMYHEHNPAKSFNANDRSTWTATWRSPQATAQDQDIIFYMVSVIGNGGGRSGDLVVTNTTQTTLPKSNFPLVAAIIEKDDVTCYGEADGQATVSVSGGESPYTYTWSNGATTSTINNISAGTYSVTVGDNLGSSVSAQVTISEPNPILLSIANKTNISCSTPEGGATVNAEGGVGSLSYQWSNGSTTRTVSNLPDGRSTVTVTDNTGCQESIAVNISSDLNAPIVNAGNDGVITCATTIVPLDPIVSDCNNCQTEWSTQDGLIIEGDSPNELFANQAGTYTFKATNLDNGCSSSDEIVITQPLPVTIELNNLVSNSCYQGNDGEIQVDIQDGIAPYSIEWSTGATSQAIQNLEAGLYTVHVTDAGGCTDSLIVTITEPDALSLEAILTDVTCAGGTNGQIETVVQGGTPPYNITGNTQNLAAGSYEIVVEDANGCSVQQSFVINQPDFPLSAQLDSLVGITCEQDNGFARLQIAGGTPDYLISWSNGEVGLSASQLLGGNHQVTIVDAAGCGLTLDFDIPVNTNIPQATLFPADSLSCTQTRIELNGFVTGCETCIFSWSTSNGQISGSTDSLRIEVTQAGDYTLEVINPFSGCKSEQQIKVVERPPLVIAIEDTFEPTCNGFPNGEIQVAIQQGSAPYTFAWSTGGTTAREDSLPAGTYRIQVMDAAACKDSLEITLTEPSALEIRVDSIKRVTDMVPNGAVYITSSGGISPYSYIWLLDSLTISNQEDITELEAGTYQLILTDAQGCSTTVTVDVDFLITSTQGLDKPDFAIYPNPTSDRLSIQLSNIQSAKPVEISLYDFTGKRTAYRLLDNPQSGIIDWLISDKDPGMYWIQVKQGNYSRTLKLIIQ